MFIDPHVHLRDGSEKDQKLKETVKHGLQVALASGLDAVFDMPNTDPPIMNRQNVMDRLKLAKDSGITDVFYGVYIGLTADMGQVRRAVEVVREFNQVVGMKLYAGHSTGDLGVIREEDQQRIYETLSNEGYEGILAVHCEKESEMDGGLWTPERPYSHCLARPESAEIESVRDQLGFAEQYNFPGKLHIVHVSSPTAVEMIDTARSSLDVSCEVCPHHFIFDYGEMDKSNGILYKMNPPLRSGESRDQLFQHLRDGKIDWLATDHAPHTLGQKSGQNAASGITGLNRWDLFKEYLSHHGFADELIERLTFENARNRFDVDVENRNRPTEDRTDDYPMDFYGRIAEEIGY
jgi:dihydroorotase